MGKYNKDFINYGSQVSGTDITIQPQASGGTRFLSSFLGGMVDQVGGQDRQKKEKDKLAYYTSLREAGYSADEASQRVNKQYSGGFLNQILSRSQSGFQAPDPSADTFSADAAKKKADLDKTKAQADWYKRRSGNPSGTGGSGDTQRMKSLQAMIQQTQDELQTATAANKPQQALRKRLEKYQKAMDTLVGAGDEEQSSSQSGGWGNPNDVNDLGPSQAQEGSTATNPSTGKKIKTVNGRWRNA